MLITVTLLVSVSKVKVKVKVDVDGLHEESVSEVTRIVWWQFYLLARWSLVPVLYSLGCDRSIRRDGGVLCRWLTRLS